MEPQLPPPASSVSKWGGNYPQRPKIIPTLDPSDIESRQFDPVAMQQINTMQDLRIPDKPANEIHLLSFGGIANSSHKLKGEQDVSFAKEDIEGEEVCPVCQFPVDEAEARPLLECNHKVCTACLKEYLCNLVEEGRVQEFKCP
mmetsp:Transcript_3066/g.4692  ORF Transcript_3066/g.4692 Transcript_3066/m.4692 type:complete len:144 (+) Transcript_3066:300-731(+)